MLKGPMIEAFVGEYASGKSEVSINRALMLASTNQRVTIVDLDTVEPFYTLRPIKKVLEDKGLTVVCWDTKDTMGLGEAGSLLKPEMRWVLRRGGHIVLDVGYVAHGAKIFNLVEGASDHPALKIFAVVNTTRPMTSDSYRIVQYLQTLGRLDGIVHNSHLAELTDRDTIISGLSEVRKAAEQLGIPIISTCVDVDKIPEVGELELDHPVWPIQRFMQKNIW